jgi:hypothetical protein
MAFGATRFQRKYYILFLSELHFCSTILRKQNSFTFLQRNRDQLAIPITLSRTNSYDFSSIQLEI